MLRKDQMKNEPVLTGTADPAEVSRFNALADEWWKPNGAFTMVHAFNQARVTWIAERLSSLSQRDPQAPRPLEGMRIIDVGCGAGLVAEPLAKLGASVLGIDAAERNVAVAERHARQNNATVQYRHARPEDCGDLAGKFDVVMSLEVVEHVADLPAFLEQLTRLSAPGGIVLIGTINRTMRSYVKAIVGAEYVLRLLPRGTHDWRKFVTPAELADHLGANGFAAIESWGVVCNPVTWKWSIGRDVSANYLQFHRRI